MMVSVVNTKGGVGKTTTSIYLACALALRGEEVLVLDADPQGSASIWAKSAAEMGTPLPFEVRPANAGTIGPESGSGFVIVDTPPGDSPTINKALMHADLVIIPTDTSALDMTRTWATLDAAKGTPRMVLLTKSEPRTILFRQAKDILDKEDGVVCFETSIRKSQDIKGSANMRPDSLGDYEQVAAELMELVK